MGGILYSLALSTLYLHYTLSAKVTIVWFIEKCFFFINIVDMNVSGLCVVQVFFFFMFIHSTRCVYVCVCLCLCDLTPYNYFTLHIMLYV